MELENRIALSSEMKIIGPYRPPRAQKFDCVRRSYYSLFKATIERHSKTFRGPPLFLMIDNTEWTFRKFLLFARLRVAWVRN